MREKFQDIQLLEKFMAQVPREEIRFQEERLFANYLRCSGAISESACLERLACELHSAEGASMPVETNVMAIITNEILSNKYVAESIKSRIIRAVQRGRSNGSCLVYKCPELAKLMDNAKNHT
ncbi:UNVERIFIED_CONTAM: hypothetical protein PYX00_010391 [Menopon gallinae]|uniref:Uncharacterized protein n=1 Tax=Menopon gallinae TaxID=328185 RepID=A0AAW2HFA2_9NEOP